ncbi:Transcription factor, fungi [Penicillium camemberti]|uniref:Transcription factor, fungi n=1 Tax=Penicillium camemberti (strain FM 013) TaxID=1429867 RepID=A0A0G4PJL5_PENC3|nr:Transcription factor, fungi [Penicillium camemberti]
MAVTVVYTNPDDLQIQNRSNSQSSSEGTVIASPVDAIRPTTLNITEPWQPTVTSSVPEPGAFGFLSDSPSLSHGLSSSSTLSINICLPSTDIVREELDQLYLDRVHHSIPILHQRRYLSWSKSTTKCVSRTCLQYAMWALASLLSTQFRHMIEPLYQRTKQILEHLSLEANENINLTTELAQAWVLVVIFESMRTYHQQAWMSVGRAFRLVQAMRYHEIDSPYDRKGSSSRMGDFTEIEEKRRVFWMAYFLDHVISIRDDWPITLNEHVICTRLPAPDAEFQAGHHQLGPFLSEAMTDPDLKVRSPFNECLILVTICGRSLLQSQQHHISKAYGGMTIDYMEQRLWLETLLTTRLQVLSQCYPSPTEAYDPLLLFASILGQATVIYFCKMIMDSTIIPDGELEVNVDLVGPQNRALEASTNIIRLASTLRDLPFAKVHPLMPIPLFLCAEFLYDGVHTGEPFQSRLQELFHILRELKNVNNHEQSYLDLLPRSCISKTNDLFSHSVEGTTTN